MEVDGGVYRFTTNALEQAPAGGGGGGGWDDLMADHRDAGSFGAGFETLINRVLTIQGAAQAEFPVDGALVDQVAVERSTFLLTATFRNDRGEAVTPEVASWTLTDGTGEVINSRLNVAITNPASEETIVLAGADLEMFTERDRELRFLTLKWTYDSGKPGRALAEFYVKKSGAV
jgi:hypothetical protein